MVPLQREYKYKESTSREKVQVQRNYTVQIEYKYTTHISTTILPRLYKCGDQYVTIFYPGCN